jgi:regulatory protein
LLPDPELERDRTYQTLRDKAYRLLARREQSRWELRRKLEFDEHPQLVNKLLGDLMDQGAQSDFRFAEQLCRSRFNNGKGPVKLQYELNRHQIEESLVAQVMSDYEDKWLGLAIEVRQRKFGSKVPASYKDWAKQARFLQQRGFAPDQIEPYID